MSNSSNIDYSRCLVFLAGDKEWAINGNDYDSIQWLSEGNKPTEEELIAAWPQAKAAYEAKIAAKENAKKAAQDKLLALGLTVDDFKALGL